MSRPNIPEQAHGLPPRADTAADDGAITAPVRAAGPERSPRPGRTVSPETRAKISRESLARYLPKDRLEGIYALPEGAIPEELSPRWVRIMMGITPDEKNYQQAISEGYVEAKVSDFPALNRMRVVKQIPGFEDCEIRGGCVLMVRAREISKREIEARKRRIAGQMTSVKDWVINNPEEAARMGGNFERFDRSSPVQYEVREERGPAAGMFPEQ